MYTIAALPYRPNARSGRGDILRNVKSGSAMRRASESGPAFAGPAGWSTPPLHCLLLLQRATLIKLGIGPGDEANVVGSVINVNCATDDSRH